MKRTSKKNEFIKGYVRGMQNAFGRVVYLETLASAEANRIIEAMATERSESAWAEHREDVKDLEDAYTWGLNDGEQAWEDDNEMDEVAKNAELSVITK